MVIFLFTCVFQDYKLAFDWKQGLDPIDRDWKGCPATVLPSPGHVVWGTVWKIKNEDLPNLDM